MTTSPTPETRPCFGVGDCQRHAQCQRYADIERMSPDQPRILTCWDGREFSGFVELVPVERVKEQAA